MSHDDDKAWTVAMLRKLADDLEARPARILHVSRVGERARMMDARGRVVAVGASRIDELSLTIDWLPKPQEPRQTPAPVSVRISLEGLSRLEELVESIRATLAGGGDRQG